MGIDLRNVLGEAEIPKVFCEKCQKIPERVTYTREYILFRIQAKAECHGAEETFEIKDLSDTENQYVVFKRGG